MSEYLIQDTTLTNLGDKIRVLSGTDETMTPAEMASNVDEANADVDTQADLIEQIKVALRIKSEGIDSVLVDFAYTDNGDGTYTLTGWNGTSDGNTSTELIIPNSASIIV